MINSKRLTLILFGVLGLSTLIFIVLCVIGLSILGGKSQKVVDLKLQSRTVDDQVSNLAQARSEVEKFSYFKEVAKTVIPGDKDQAQAVLDIFQLANDSGINLAGITFPASNLGASAASAATSSGDTSTSASISSRNLLSQAKPVVGISGLYSVELTISPATGADVPDDKRATYPKFLDFLDRIERNRRTAQITQISIQPQSNSGVLTDFIGFNLVINIFIKP